MKHFLRHLGFAALALIAMSTNGYAQVVTVFSEDFDSPPHNVITSHTLPGTIQYWNDTNALSVSGTHSFHAKVLPLDTIVFETPAFSTVGKPFVRLTFDHIAKIHFGQRGIIRVSNDNGATWTTLSASQYRGQSLSFGPVGNYFNELSYANPASTPYWGGQTTVGQGIAPTNSWWEREVFDISNVAGSGPSGTANGYSQVKVKFVLQYRSPSGTANPAGWFVDNVNVIAGPCELIPPKINWNLSPRREPIGARYQATEQVRLRVSDKVLPKSGVDSVVLHFQINGGTWNVLNMTAVNTAACPDSSEYTHTFTGLVVGDTINWWVEAFDCACDENTVRSPSAAAPITFNTFWRDPAPPAVCGQALPNSFPFVATQFPYIENFEAIYWMAGSGAGTSGTSHRGVFPLGNPPAGRNYEVSPNPLSSGFAWSVRVGQTGTFGTGPDGDHTTGSGKYLYTESSQGSPGNTTIFITPCLKLDNISHAAAEFYYHKFGTHMGNLRVDIDTGVGFANNLGVIGAVTIPGQTHRSLIDPWDKAFIDLTPYLGKYVRLRFVGTKNNSATNDRGDMAIDDIKIFQPYLRDINFIESLNPKNGFCSYSSTEDVQVHFRNEGSQPLTQIPLAFSVKNLATGVTTILRDTVNGTFGLGDTLTYTYVPKANLATVGNYELYMWSELAGDGQSQNDSLGPILIEHEATITSFPYFLNFDGPGWTAGNATSANPGSFGTTDWSAVPSPTSGNYSFMVGSDMSPSSTSGPRWSKNRKGNYLYTEGNYGSNSPFALFQQDGCFDFGALTDPHISFWYHMYGADIASLALQVVLEGTNTWITVPGSTILGQNQTSKTSDWKYTTVSLAAYAGQTVKLRFVAGKVGSGELADIAIDDIMVYNRVPNDVGVTFVVTPPNTVNLNQPVPINIEVRNYGSQPKTNVPVTIEANNLCNPSLSGTHSAFVPSIPAGGSVNFITNVSNFYSGGDMNIKAYTTLAGDSYAQNDTASKPSNGTDTVNIPFGPITFDNCSANEYGFYTQGGAGTLQQWEMGVPGKGITAASGTNVWVTKRGVNYLGSGDEYLRVPPLSNFDTIFGAELRFKHRFAFSSLDGGNIEYLNQGQWLTLGSSAVNLGQNWYGSSYGTNGLASLGNKPGWTGSTGGQWITSMIPLSLWNEDPDPAMFRFHMGTASGSSGSGWAIDDFEIYVPPQNSLAAIAIDTKEYLVVPNGSSTVKVLVQNTGAKPVTEGKIRYQVNGGPWTVAQNLVLNPPLPRGGKRWLEFTTPWLNSGPGQYSLCVETSRPNNKQDNLSADDILCEVITVSDKITIDTSGYCNDFEDPTKPVWLPLHSSIKTLPHDWEFGTPAQTVLNSAASGSNAWMTKLSSNYTSMGRSSLHTPFFVLDSNVVYTMKFDHNMFSEQYHDGGSIDWSYNGGINWYTLGNVFPSGKWYNTVHVTALDNVRPGWSGTTNGWTESKINFTAENPGTLVFRFRFGTDYTLTNEGWAIDNFCLEQAPLGSTADIIGIGTPEATLTNAFLSGISPNPTQGGPVGMDFQSNESGSIRLTVYNMLGQPVISQDFDHEGGLVRLDWETAQLAAGMYNAVVEWKGQSYTRRFVR
jgi:hypothetical protein